MCTRCTSKDILSGSLPSLVTRDNFYIQELLEAFLENFLRQPKMYSLHGNFGSTCVVFQTMSHTFPNINTYVNIQMWMHSLCGVGIGELFVLNSLVWHGSKRAQLLQATFIYIITNRRNQLQCMLQDNFGSPLVNFQTMYIRLPRLICEHSKCECSFWGSWHGTQVCIHSAPWVPRLVDTCAI